MNKKQLTLQNSSLFAELERKAKDTEILNIRLEEAEQQLKAIFDENEELKNSLERAEAEKKELCDKLAELETALAEAKAKIQSISNAVAEEKIDVPEDKPLSPIDLAISKKINEVAELAEDTEANEDIEPAAPVVVAEPDLSAEPDFSDESDSSDESGESATPDEGLVTETLTPPTSIFEENERAEATADLLRNYGAKIIGKVTRVTAEVLSRVGSLNNDAAESLKTLALGKNESFKYQIIELARAKNDAEKIMAEMDFLADEAIVYLRSI